MKNNLHSILSLAIQAVTSMHGVPVYPANDEASYFHDLENNIFVRWDYADLPEKETRSLEVEVGVDIRPELAQSPKFKVKAERIARALSTIFDMEQNHQPLWEKKADPNIVDLIKDSFRMARRLTKDDWLTMKH